MKLILTFTLVLCTNFLFAQKDYIVYSKNKVDPSSSVCISTNFNTLNIGVQLNYFISESNIGFYTNLRPGILYKKASYYYNPEGSMYVDEFVPNLNESEYYILQKKSVNHSLYSAGILFSFFNNQSISIYAQLGASYHIEQEFEQFREIDIEYGSALWEDYEVDEHFFGDRPFQDNSASVNRLNLNLGLNLQADFFNIGIGYDTSHKNIFLNIGYSI